MRIVFLLATRNFGGAQRSTLEMADRLQQNHEILVVEVEGLDKNYIKAITDFGLSLKQYEGEIGLNGPLRKLTSWCKWSKWIRGVFMEWNPDVVIVKDTKTLSLLSRKSNYKIYFHARAWYASYQISNLKRVIFKRTKPHFLAVSQATRQALFNAGLTSLENISVVPNALNLPKSFERKSCTSGKLRLIHAGGFIATKGQHIALEVAAYLKSSDVPFHLTLVGFVYNTVTSRDYFNNLKEFVDRNGLQGNVSFLTNKNNLKELYLENDVLLYPSATEGLPRVVMEAMHYKLAVIANPVGGVIDIVQDGVTGFITDFNNIKAYSNSVEVLFNNPNLRLCMGERASTLIQQCYTADNQMSKIDFIFSD